MQHSWQMRSTKAKPTHFGSGFFPASDAGVLSSSASSLRFRLLRVALAPLADAAGLLSRSSSTSEALREDCGGMDQWETGRRADGKDRLLVGQIPLQTAIGHLTFCSPVSLPSLPTSGRSLAGIPRHVNWAALNGEQELAAGGFQSSGEVSLLLASFSGAAGV